MGILNLYFKLVSALIKLSFKIIIFVIELVFRGVGILLNKRKKKTMKFKNLDKALTEINKIKDNKKRGYAFEALVKEIYIKLGHQAYTVDELKAAGHFSNHAGVDQGADVIVLDENGNIAGLVQCKYYKGVVGNKSVQEIVGAKGLYVGNNSNVWTAVVTNSNFTMAATQLAEANGVKLHDGMQLENALKNLSVA